MTTEKFNAMLDSMTDHQIEAFAAAPAISIPTDATRERLTRDIQHKLASQEHVIQFKQVSETSIHGRQS